MSFLYFLEDIRNPVLDFLFSIITLFGSEALFVLGGMLVFWCVDKNKGYFLLLVGFVGTVLNQFLKILCQIPRPWELDPDFTIVESARADAEGYSFPSGHTQTAVGFYGGIARATTKKWLRIGMIALSLLVGLSRMYLGVHTPADVLVSLLIATVLIFVVYPYFRKVEHSPKVIYAILFSLLGIVIAYLCFVLLFHFPAEVYAEKNLANLKNAQKNGFTLLGCALGIISVYIVDWKWTKFQTTAVWWAQILKVVGGMILVGATYVLPKAPLNALFNGHPAANSVRYFLIVFVGGVLWPMTFRFFARLGQPKAKAPQSVV